MRLNTSADKKVKKYFLIYISCLLLSTKYHQANKQYPQNLESLIPKYIKDMPHHPNGNRLEYRSTKNGLSYELSFIAKGRRQRAEGRREKLDW